MDDRFSSMRAKGINTNDATATASDILQGKTAYVAGQKLTGTYQDALSRIGTPISIETMSNASAGDFFSGVKTEDIQPVTERSASTIYPFLASYSPGDITLSEDNKVLFKKVTVYSDTPTTLPVYFMDMQNDTYVEYDTTINVTIHNSDISVWNMTDDGSVIIGINRSGSGEAIVIEVDKQNKTTSAYYFSNVFDDYYRSTNLSILGNYIAKGKGVFTYSKSTHSFTFVGEAPMNLPNHAIGYYYKIDNNNFLCYKYNSGAKLYKVSISGSTITCTEFTCSNTLGGFYISADGKYLFDQTGTYSIDIPNTTLTFIVKYTYNQIVGGNYGTVSGFLYNNLLYCNDRYIIDFTGFPNTTPQRKYQTTYQALPTYSVSPSGFDPTAYFSAENKVTNVIDVSSNADYVVNPVETPIDSVGADKVYGIYPESMSAHDVGTGRLLIDTYQS